MNARIRMRKAGRLPLLLLAAALLAALAAGVYATEFQVFLYDAMRSAWRTAANPDEHRTRDPFLRNATFVDVAPARAAEKRFEFFAADALADPILVPGGAGRFSDLCPDAAGCLAVEYAGRGEVARVWPYRPREIDGHPPLVALPRERAPGSLLDRYVRLNASRYADGDLLVAFEFYGSFPYALGAARIDPDGRPVWRRADYSHRIPAIVADDMALIPGLRIGGGPPVAPGRSDPPSCDKHRIGHVHVIDGEGTLLKEIDVLAALLESPWAFVLERTPDPCRPLHIASVRELGPSAAGAEGMEPGDLVVSMKKISAFAILDRDDGRVKKLVRGSFRAQHTVTHLEGSRFLVFDNLGWDRETDGDGESIRARLLMVDAADDSETTVFPNEATPERLKNLFSHIRGHVSVSPDRRRAWATFFASGTAVEVRLSDGAVLAAFTSLHDVSHLDRFPEERKTKAVRYKLSGVSYAGAREE